MTQKRKDTKIWIVFVVLILLGVLIYSLTDFLTELLWFREMGYIAVFFTEIKAKLMLGAPTFVVVAAVAALFFVALKRSFLAGGYELDEAGKKGMRKVGIILSLVFSAVLTTAVISALWWQILRYINASQFGVNDPIFNNDIGFYVFKLEFLQALNASGLHLVIALLASTFIYYISLLNYAKPSESPEADTYEYDIPPAEGYGPAGPFFDMFGKEIRDRRNAQQRQLKQTGQALLKVAGAQISILGVLAFLLVGIHFALKCYDLLYSGTGVTYGAGYTDIVVRLNMYRALVVLSALSAIFFVVALRSRKIRLGIIFPILMALVLGAGSLATGAVQSLIVSPDEINKERPYLKNNIEYTRMAYDIQDIRTEDFVPRNDLTKKDVLANMGTLSNVRINDFEPAQQFYNQTQSIRTYYRFDDVDVDRYYVNGEYTQVFLSAREIDQDRIEDQWLIRHLKYTHGYGITLSRVDKVTSSGQPDMLIDSIPPVSEVPEIQISR
ncbi:MAG: COG1615 family transporter, partial [Clostridiales bacterium]|nr:COG1615 family transporter [Clostridiales bacterium]